MIGSIAPSYVASACDPLPVVGELTAARMPRHVRALENELR